MLDKEIFFIKEIQPSNSKLNRFRNKYHSDNTINSNRNIKNKLINKKL